MHVPKLLTSFLHFNFFVKCVLSLDEIHSFDILDEFHAFSIQSHLQNLKNIF